MAKISQSTVYALPLGILFFVQHKQISVTSLFVNFTWKFISLSATWFDGRIYMNREVMLNAPYLELQQGCDHLKAACDCIDHTANYKLPATPLPWQKSVWPICSNTVSHTHATLHPPYTPGCSSKDSAYHPLNSGIHNSYNKNEVQLDRIFSLVVSTPPYLLRYELSIRVGRRQGNEEINSNNIRLLSHCLLFPQRAKACEVWEDCVQSLCNIFAIKKNTCKCSV